MPDQSNWRYCEKCHALFFNGYQGGRCPAGGSHSAQGLIFALPYGVPATATAQTNWRFCLQCNVMFFDGYAGGRCPAGGSHTVQGINFVLPHDLPATPKAQANWRFCQKCNTMFYDGYPDKGTCPAGGGHSAQGFNFNLPIQQEPAGTAPVSPSIANVPWEKYVDQFTECTYDVNYKVTNYFSTTLQLKYRDAMSLELDIEKDFSEQNLTPEAARDAMAKGFIGRNGRIFPTVLMYRTTPRLWAVRAEAFRMQDEAFADFAHVAVAGVAAVLTVPAMAAGAPAEEAAVSNTRVTRRSVQGTSRGGGGRGGGGGAGGGGGGGGRFYQGKPGQPIIIDAGGESGTPGIVDLNPYNGSEMAKLTEAQIQQRIKDGVLVRGGIEELEVHFAPNSVTEIRSQRLPSLVVGRHPKVIIQGSKMVLKSGGKVRIHTLGKFAPDIEQQFRGAGWTIDPGGFSVSWTKP
jgi:hypothetical protein